MRRLIMLAVALAALTLLAMGCGQGDDGLTQPANQATGGAGVVHGEMSVDQGSFELVVNSTSDPSDDQPGPFVIRGDSIHYDFDLGALVVNLTLTNASEETYFEPVSLTFVQLMPDSIQVLNADNGETGAGASFEFQFENDDAMWTPGETSLARVVQFGVEPGVSVGFVARVDVSSDHPGLGSIGGLVWHDENEDGVIDGDESGLGGVEIALFAGAEADTMGDDPDWLAVTAADGTYRFDGLSAGFYTVIRVETDHLESTTASQIQVILVEHEGDVSDFLAANFGCLVVDDPGGIPGLDGYVEIKGDYDSESGWVEAREIKLKDCDDKSRCKSEMYGPVTSIDLEERAVEVMGTWIYVEDEDDDDDDDKHGNVHLEDLEVGDRVKVNIDVIEDDDETYYMTDDLKRTGGHDEKIKGFVNELLMDDDEIVGIRVFETAISFP